MTPNPCFECGAPSEAEHHVVPQSRGGTKTVHLCGQCHGKAHHSDKNMTSKKLTHEALQRKKNNNERVGMIPFGHDLTSDGKHLIKNSREQAVIQLMQLLRYESHMSYQKIAALLNRKKIPTKFHSAQWESTTVYRILKRWAAMTVRNILLRTANMEGQTLT